MNTIEIKQEIKKLNNLRDIHSFLISQKCIRKYSQNKINYFDESNNLVFSNFRNVSRTETKNDEQAIHIHPGKYNPNKRYNFKMELDTTIPKNDKSYPTQTPEELRRRMDAHKIVRI